MRILCEVERGHWVMQEGQDLDLLRERNLVNLTDRMEILVVRAEQARADAQRFCDKAEQACARIEAAARKRK